MKKRNKGFTLVELIIIIAVLALLAVGAVLAFAGIQANARRSVLSADTRALMTAGNAAISTAAARGLNNITATITATHRLEITVPAGAGLSQEIFYVDFDTAAHATRAISALTFVPPPATEVPGAAGSFAVDATRIATWGAAQVDTAIPGAVVPDLITTTTGLIARMNHRSP